MTTKTIEITISINNADLKFFVPENESLLDVLRRASYYSVECGCGDGTCGVCTVLVNANLCAAAWSKP